MITLDSLYPWLAKNRGKLSKVIYIDTSSAKDTSTLQAILTSPAVPFNPFNEDKVKLVFKEPVRLKTDVGDRQKVGVRNYAASIMCGAKGGVEYRKGNITHRFSDQDAALLDRVEKLPAVSPKDLALEFLDKFHPSAMKDSQETIRRDPADFGIRRQSDMLTKSVFECEDCGKHYVKDTSSPDSKLEYAVHCCMCHKLWPRKTAHLLYENDAYGHFLGDCCWDERLRD